MGVGERSRLYSRRRHDVCRSRLLTCMLCPSHDLVMIPSSWWSRWEGYHNSRFKNGTRT